MLNIGIIGYGGRMNTVASEILKTGKAKITAITDIDIEAVKKNYNLDDSVRYYTDAEEMIKNEQLDGLAIGTRCDSHTEYTLLAAKYNLPLFLEKPVCTSYEDLAKLKAIPKEYGEKVVVSFPLRLSQTVLYVKEIIDSGRLGKIEHVQAYNNVPYARGYYHKWYRDESITGGLFLQKATHDLDYICYLLGDLKPVRVCAMKSKQIFKGDKPAGLLCENCAEARECPESPENVRKNNDGYIIGKYCCFATDTGNEDSGSAIVEFDSGMHAVYSQDFITRNGAGKRGARLIGYKGTVEFDWFSDEVTVYHHLENATERHTLAKCSEGHFGGDAKLVKSFIDVMLGEAKSVSTLRDGILSAELCLGAKKSSEEHIFVDIEQY